MFVPPLLLTSAAVVFLPTLLLRSLRSGWYALHAILVMAASWWLGSRMGFPPFSPPLWAWSIVIHLVIVNLLVMAAYGWDKRAAIRGDRRVPERVLHGLALVGGTPFAWIASRLFRHKTKKASFRSGFWAIVMMQVMAVIGLIVIAARNY